MAQAPPAAASATWLVTVGASLTVGAVIGSLGHRVRGLLAAEQATVERLRELDAMKDTFITAISHEIRTPLTVIVGLTSTLHDHGERIPEDDRRDVIARLTSHARRLERLVENVMDIQRLTHGSVTAHRTEVDLSQLVLEVAGSVELHGPLHTSAEPVLARVDPTLTRRIVENLLVNAAKYTSPETPVWVWATHDPDGVTLVVEDAGDGVPDHLKDEIFEAFTRADPDHPSPGTGVGLSLVARFAGLHGGRAWAEDRPGGGARFCVWLPHGPLGPPARSGARSTDLPTAMPAPARDAHDLPRVTRPRD